MLGVLVTYIYIYQDIQRVDTVSVTAVLRSVYGLNAAHSTINHWRVREPVNRIDVQILHIRNHSD